MNSPLPDPTAWLTDLIKTQNPMVLWPLGDVANTSAALTAAAAPWTQAVAQMTKWQTDAMTAFWAPFAGGGDAPKSDLTRASWEPIASARAASRASSRRKASKSSST